MKAAERSVLRQQLEKEMKFFRQAFRKDPYPRPGLLRAIRQALGCPAKDMALYLDVHRSRIFEVERCEQATDLTIRKLKSYAHALACELVYGLVPANSETFDELAAAKRWKNFHRGAELREKYYGTRAQRRQALKEQKRKARAAKTPRPM